MLHHTEPAKTLARAKPGRVLQVQGALLGHGSARSSSSPGCQQIKRHLEPLKRPGTLLPPSENTRESTQQHVTTSQQKQRQKRWFPISSSTEQFHTQLDQPEGCTPAVPAGSPSARGCQAAKGKGSASPWPPRSAPANPAEKS